MGGETTIFPEPSINGGQSSGSDYTSKSEHEKQKTHAVRTAACDPYLAWLRKMLDCDRLSGRIANMDALASIQDNA